MDFKFKVGDKVHFINDTCDDITPYDVGVVIGVKLGSITNKPFYTVEWGRVIAQHYEDELIHVVKQKSGFGKWINSSSK